MKLATPMTWMAGVASIVLSLWGCGGQVTEDPPAGPEATAPVTMTFTSDTSGDSLNLSANKDASGFADTRLDGGDVSGIGNEDVDVVCDLTFGHAERTGNALTSTGIEVRDLNDSFGAACANPSKCIECQNEWKTWDDVALAWVADPSHSHCVGTCTGVVPANAATELDELEVYSHFYGTVTSDMPSVDLAGLLYQGWIENWPTLDFSDVLGTPGTYEAVVLDATGDFTFSFLQDPFATHGLATRDVIEAAGWTRGIDITALDSTPAAGVGSGEIHTQHLASMPFTGAASGSVNLSAGPLSVALTLCDDVHFCEIVSEDETFAAAENMMVLDVLSTMIFPLNMGLPISISDAVVAYNLSMDDTSANASNIYVVVDTLIGDQVQPQFTDFNFMHDIPNSPPIVDAVILGIADGYKYQQQAMTLTVKDQVAGDGRVQDADIVVPFTSSCAISDDFYQEATLTDCFEDEFDMPDQHNIVQGTMTAANAIAAGILNVEVTGAPTNYDRLLYSDASIAGAGGVVALTKANVKPSYNFDETYAGQAELTMSHVEGVNDAAGGRDRDAILFSYLESAGFMGGTPGDGFFMGVEAMEYDPVGHPGVYHLYCVAYQWDGDMDSGAGGVQSGTRADCSAYSSFSFILGEAYDGIDETITALFNLGGTWYDIDSMPGAEAYEAGKPTGLTYQVGFMSQWDAHMILQSSSNSGGDIRATIEAFEVRGMAIEDSNFTRQPVEAYPQYQ